MVYRDYVFTGKRMSNFVRYTWPAVQEALEHLRKYDRDGDGVPQNDGYPDQTYDEWVVHGESAYCGGLWLAALRAAEEMGRVLEDTPPPRNITTCSPRPRQATSRSYGRANISATTRRANTRMTFRPTNSPASGTRT